jgi:hypothetical protein
MKKIIYICCLLSIVWLRMQGQRLQVQGSRVELPPGDVLGAAFYEDKGMFVIQQYVRSAENGGLLNRYHRQLSSWNIESHSMITKRVIDAVPRDVRIFPPGHIEASTITHRVYLCSAESHLEIMDPDSLETVGTMAQVDGQIIVDFAVDDPRSRVLVLSARRDGSIHLTSYSLLLGEKQQETVLPSIDSDPDSFNARMDLISVSRTGQIAIYLQDLRGLKSKPGIYMCKDEPDFTCTKNAYFDETHRPSEISFLGETLLSANHDFFKSDCIVSIDPGYKYTLKKPFEMGFANKYCSRTGVHYAVGVAENKYVVGFTGVGEYHPWSEHWETVSSSFSVWRAGTSGVAAVVQDPTDCATPFCGIRIAASKTNPLFITYQETSNALFLYSIMDHN